MSASKNDLPEYSLYINPRDLRQLRSDIWNNEHVPAKLRVSKSSYNIQIAYRGALTRELVKKSYHVIFSKPSFFMGAREIHLNAEYLDPSLLRNKLALDFFVSLGILSPESKYVLLRINGAIMGVYLQLESVDDLFLKKRGLPAGAIFYAHNDDANYSLLSPDNDDVKESLLSGYMRKFGDAQDDQYLFQLIYKINTVPRSEFAKEIVKHVHIEKYLRWLAGVVCTQNYDGFIQNYALYRNSATGLFEIIPWDYDGTWGRNCHGNIMENSDVPIQGYNTLTARILDVPQFRNFYRGLLEKVLESLFTVDFLKPIITSLYKMLRPYILLDPYKQKDMVIFDSEPEFIIRFIAERNSYLREHLSDLE
ncbi:CotH kinase family protein [Pelotomaculum propionicicum]|uniref:Inner spore coat protein H n=1 Tax=Pelotomaculum propionicicum TaxID=258475 RepID=A0A4Y7RUA4_9FIRM|nr:CotH kinase family protein [Pelotomaculum propionicicum]TEB12568.1 Inner spore coat protein H [Pelotomaculum propionicicum]